MDATQHGQGPALVFAGAGAGKTRTLTHRVKHLVGQGVDPHGIMLVTFTNKAAGEMRSRIAGLLELPEVEAVWIGTFHRFCLQALLTYGEEIGLGQFSVLDAAGQDRLVEGVIASVWKEGKGKPPGFTPRNILGAISRAASSGWDDVQLATMYADLTEKVVSCKYAYMAAKKEQGLLDYDDLLLQGVRLFKLSSRATAMARRRCTYVMVDEFQDTNAVQLELVRALSPGQAPNLMVVGDPDQSIYGWRGADYRTILRFQSMYPAATVYNLYTNYRSTRAVVDLANRVIARNQERKPGSQVAAGPAGTAPVAMAARDRMEEAAFVARAVAHYHRQGVQYEEMAVLMRANFLSVDLEQALKAHRIAYQFTGGLSFFERVEVRLALAVLKALVNPRDGLSVGYLVEELVDGAGSAGVQKVLEAGKARGLSPLESFRDPVALKGLRGEAVRQAASSIAGLLDGQAAKVSQQPIDGLLEETLEALPVEAWLKKQADGLAEATALRAMNQARLLELVRGWRERHPDSPASELLASLALEALEKPEEGKGVSLMTIHASKGMEFRVVFVVGLTEGVFPLSKAAQTPEGLEEERRLMYVAVTRAKDHLHLSYARQGFKGAHQTPSRFISEAGLEAMPYDPRIGFHGAEVSAVAAALANL